MTCPPQTLPGVPCALQNLLVRTIADITNLSDAGTVSEPCPMLTRQTLRHIFFSPNAPWRPTLPRLVSDECSETFLRRNKKMCFNFSKAPNAASQARREGERNLDSLHLLNPCSNMLTTNYSPCEHVLAYVHKHFQGLS